MSERTKQVAIRITPGEKQQIREAAAAAGKSMAGFVRDRALEGLPATETADEIGMSPLEDFIAAHVHIDSDAEPVAKRTVYEIYEEFMELRYPNQAVASQHKVSREIAAQDGVETGRVYIDTESEDQRQVRCYKNISIGEGLD